VHALIFYSDFSMSQHKSSATVQQEGTSFLQVMAGEFLRGRGSDIGSSPISGAQPPWGADSGRNSPVMRTKTDSGRSSPILPDMQVVHGNICSCL